MFEEDDHALTSWSSAYIKEAVYGSSEGKEGKMRSFPLELWDSFLSNACLSKYNAPVPAGNQVLEEARSLVPPPVTVNLKLLGRKL